MMSVKKEPPIFVCFVEVIEYLNSKENRPREIPLSPSVRAPVRIKEVVGTLQRAWISSETVAKLPGREDFDGTPSRRHNVG
jgi:hypothetical protein